MQKLFMGAKQRINEGSLEVIAFTLTSPIHSHLRSRIVSLPELTMSSNTGRREWLCELAMLSSRLTQDSRSVRS